MVNITPTMRIEGGVLPSATIDVIFDERSVELAVDWIRLENAMAPVTAAAQAAYQSEERGVGDPRNFSFAEDLIAAGQMMLNSGTAMMLQGEGIQTMIRERAAAPPSAQPVFPQAVAVPADSMTDTTMTSDLAKRPVQQSAPELPVASQSASISMPSLIRTSDSNTLGNVKTNVVSMKPAASEAGDVQLLSVISGKQARKEAVPMKKEPSPFERAAAKPLPKELPKSTLFSPSETKKTSSAAPSSTSAAYLCNMCTAKFQSPEELFTHVDVSHKPQPATSKTVTPVTSSSTSTTRTQGPSTNPVPPNVQRRVKFHKCQQCPKVFESAETLQRHCTTNHGVPGRHQAPPKASVTGQHRFAFPAVFKCRICGKAFGTVASLNSHKVTHILARPQAQPMYECDQCFQRFDSTHKLNRHVITHTSAGRHYCDHPGCGRHYSSKYSLKDHKKSHVAQVAPPTSTAATTSTPQGQVKLFPCPYCEKRCVSPPALRKHIHEWHRDQHAEGKPARHGRKHQEK